MFNTILSTIRDVVIIGLAGLIVWFLLFKQDQPRAVLSLGTTKQETKLSPLPITATNNPALLWQMVNDYRTSSGWIASSNQRIYAGLSNRTWSTSFQTTPEHKNELMIWAGTGGGISYQRSILEHFTVGGLFLIDPDKTFRAFAGIGHKW